VRSIFTEALDEASLGELLMHFMLETIIAAHLLGVDRSTSRPSRTARCWRRSISLARDHQAPGPDGALATSGIGFGYVSRISLPLNPGYGRHD